MYNIINLYQVLKLYFFRKFYSNFIEKMDLNFYHEFFNQKLKNCIKQMILNSCNLAKPR